MKAFLLILVLLVGAFAQDLSTTEIDYVEDNSTTCTICTDLVGALESAIGDNSSQPFLLLVLAQACDALELPPVIALCKAIVSEWGPQLINDVLANQPTSVVCSELDLCSDYDFDFVDEEDPGMTISIEEDSISVKDDSFECQICGILVNALESAAETNTSESFLLEAIDDACALLPSGTWVTICKQIVNNLGPDIIKYVLSGENSSVICEQVGLCNDSLTSFRFEQITITETRPNKAVLILETKQPKVGDDIVCAVCAWVATRVEHWLDSNKTQTEILDLIEKDCDILIDKKWVDSCKDTVAKYGGDIIQKIVADEPPPSVLCTDLDLCPKNSTVPVDHKQQEHELPHN